MITQSTPLPWRSLDSFGPHARGKKGIRSIYNSYAAKRAEPTRVPGYGSQDLVF